MATNIPGPPPAGAPPKKSGGALKFVLIGCGALMLIGVLAVGGVVFYGVHKAKQMGLDPDLMKRNPAFATAKMLASVNPDIEILSADEGKGVLVIRDKKDGKKLTIDVAETARNKKIVFRGENGEELSFSGDTNKQGEGFMQMKTKDGTTTFGAGGAAKFPSWVPVYPGANPDSKFSVQGDKEDKGAFMFTTKDTAEKVTDFYEQNMKSAGMTITKTTMPGGALVSGQDAANKRNVVAHAMSENGQTQVSISYERKE